MSCQDTPQMVWTETAGCNINKIIAGSIPICSLLCPACMFSLYELNDNALDNMKYVREILPAIQTREAICIL